MTTFLKFPDQATFQSLLPADFVPYGETGYPLPDGVGAISVIGTIYDATGTLIPGWHVNALGTIPDTWQPYVIVPVNPVRVF